MVAHDSIGTGRHRAYPAGRAANPTGRAAMVVSVAAITTAWVAVTLTAPHLKVSTSVRDVALFVHLAGVVLGFGAVLTVDWFGLLWALRLRPLTALLQVAGGVHVPIWVGLAALMASGVLTLISQAGWWTATLIGFLSALK